MYDDNLEAETACGPTDWKGRKESEELNTNGISSISIYCAAISRAPYFNYSDWSISE
jgi:hypothetical protein